VFLSLEQIKKIVVVLPADAVDDFTSSIQPGEQSLVQAVAGGATRQESVYNGLKALDPGQIGVVAIHDAARPLVSPEVVRKSLELAAEGTPAAACTRVRDTIKREKDGFVQETVERGELWHAQTPQTFPLEMILEAHRAARRDGFSGTDDVSLCERLGKRVRIVESDTGNIKITDNSDLEYLEYRLTGEKLAQNSHGRALRIGEGFDVHPLVKGRRLVIGGVEIPFEKGLAGHSDADSSALLAQVVGMLQKEGLCAVNLDATVIAQRPKLTPYMVQIRENIARILGADIHQVSVKAKTHEGLGALGRGEGIAARAVVLVSTEK